MKFRLNGRPARSNYVTTTSEPMLTHSSGQAGFYQPPGRVLLGRILPIALVKSGLQRAAVRAGWCDRRDNFLKFSSDATLLKIVPNFVPVLDLCYQVPSNVLWDYLSPFI